MSDEISIQDLASKWLNQDQDPDTHKEIADLVQSDDVVELEKRLRKPISFGTAGLRSSMKAGYAHMNALTVLQASQGLARYILDQQSASRLGGDSLRIVIGHDARHHSAKFARLAADAFVAKGFEVLWFETLVHTPMVPFAVGRYKAAAGVMVTASHNPKNDNGYKVYWSNGCQIIPPHDTGIAQCIRQVASNFFWDPAQDIKDSNPAIKFIFAEATQAYYASLQRLVAPPVTADPPMSFVYTPMHGVGLPFMKEVAHLLDIDETSMFIVHAQALPDPEFPTVPFPNPEEKGALQLAIQEAESSSSSIIIANDPDADRFAVAQQLDDRTWHQFTGNQMGILLGSYVLETWTGDKTKLAMLASTVSSRMLAAMAAKEGFHFRETLTGFKWLGNVARQLTAEGYTPAYAFEEAIGYMFPSVVWDKDGIAAAAVFLNARRSWLREGLTPWQKLQQLYQRYGYFEDANTYLISPSADVTTAVFAAIRTLNEGSPPSKLGSRRILRWRDLTLGFDDKDPQGVPDLPVDATAQMITCELGDVVFTARGSGTEPKIKLYIEGTAASSAAAKAKASEVLQDLLVEWFRPDEYGLRLAGS
nr:putative phosphoribomutase [Quercus suber]